MFRKKIIFTFAILLMVFTLLISSSSIAEEKEKIDKKVYDSLNKQDEVRVFIKIINYNNGKEILSKKKNKISNLLGQEKIKYDFGDTISAYVDKQDLDNLMNDYSIESIRLIGKKYVLLQDSVPLINGTPSYSLKQNGINLTGSGEAICILDTGVNYSHSSLGGCYGNNNASSSCKILGGYDFVNSDSDPVDDEGHGTHVSGIAAANGTINGVAPNAKIIAIKVCDSSGSCADDDIAAGINWCVGNSSTYNISVISMSLGGELYSSYCDSQPNATIFVNPINSATAKNISVVIASGNGLNNDGVGKSNQISNPACIQNATAVGATTKSDSIASYSDRWLLGTLFATGSSINSTSITGGYTELSGTSMATPHAAGAFAIINQHIRQSGRTKTPREVENAFNNTGKLIYDSSSGRNYSRINIYSAIISLDNQSPNVSLINPGNNNLNSSSNQTFRCNATDLALKNVTFYLWYSNNSLTNTTFRNISGSSYAFEINITSLSSDIYKWNCLFTDENNNAVFAQNNFTLYTNDPIVTLSSPSNASSANQNQSFSCLGNSTLSMSNITFYLWYSNNSLTNTTFRNISGLNNATNFNFTFAIQDNYKWNCLFTKNNSNSLFAQINYSIIYDTTSPNVSIVTPLPSDETSSNISKTFYFNVSDNLNIKNCSLIVNNEISLTNSSISNLSLTQSITQYFTPGAYTWSVNCSDFGNNQANSSSQSLTISAPSSGSGSSGGGGGGGTVQTAITNEQILSGVSKQYSTGDKIRISLNNLNSKQVENHTITINSVANNSVSITIQSTPIALTLQSGEFKKLNLTSAEYYDLFIKLESVAAKKANLTIKQINEPIQQIEKLDLTTNSTNNDEQSNADIKKTNIKNYASYIFYAIILGVIIWIVSMMKKPHKSNKKRKIRRMTKLK